MNQLENLQHSKVLVEAYQRHLRSLAVYSNSREPATEALSTIPLLSMKRQSQSIRTLLELKHTTEFNIPLQTDAREVKSVSQVKSKSPNEKIADILNIPKTEEGAYLGTIPKLLRYGSEAGSAEDLLYQYFNECIPCEDRIKALAEWDFLDEDFWESMKEMLNQNLEYHLADIYGFLSMLQNNEILDDLCRILSYLNFMCIPDLKAIIALLMLLQTLLLDSLRKSWSKPLFSIAANILEPFITKLEELLRYVMNKLLAPIFCLIDSINVQLAKIPGQEQSIEYLLGQRQNIRYQAENLVIGKRSNPRQQLTGVTKAGPKGESQLEVNKPAIDLKSTEIQDPNNPSIAGFALLQSMEAGLAWVSYYLMLGVKRLVDMISTLEEEIRSWLGDSQTEMNWQVSTLGHLKRIARLINVVQVIIKIKQLGGEICNNEKLLTQRVADSLDATTSTGITPVQAEDGSWTFKIGEKTERINPVDETNEQIKNKIDSGRKVVNNPVIAKCGETNHAKVAKWVNELMAEAQKGIK